MDARIIGYFSPYNVYITNLDETIDEEQLRKTFSKFGEIMSVKVMTDENNRSSGFGYVSYCFKIDATVAVCEMNNKPFGSKVIQVSKYRMLEDKTKQNTTSPSNSTVPSQAVSNPGQEPLTSSMLASVPAPEQKQMLGQRLFPLIQHQFPDRPGKITGMLLEIDNSELLHLLENPESLKSKVDEAVAVLEDHESKQVPSQAVSIPGQEPLTSKMLASAPADEQKQMLRERLNFLIQHQIPDRPEIDNSDWLNMLESLEIKIKEAAAILQDYKTKQVPGIPNKKE